MYDIELTEELGLFLGIGTGVSGGTLYIQQLGPTNVNKKYKDTLFSYQLTSGFAWNFAQRAALRVVYKYFTTAGSKDFDPLDSHNLELGVQVDL